MKENSTLDLSRGLMCESNLDAYLSRNQSVFCDEDVIIFLNQLYQRTDLRCTSTRCFPAEDGPPGTGCCACASAWAPRWRRSSRRSNMPLTPHSTPSTSGTPLSAMGFSMALPWKRSMRSWPRNRSSPCSEWTRIAEPSNQTKIPLPVDWERDLLRFAGNYISCLPSWKALPTFSPSLR